MMQVARVRFLCRGFGSNSLTYRVSVRARDKAFLEIRNRAASQYRQNDLSRAECWIARTFLKKSYGL